MIIDDITNSYNPDHIGLIFDKLLGKTISIVSDFQVVKDILISYKLSIFDRNTGPIGPCVKIDLNLVNDGIVPVHARYRNNGITILKYSNIIKIDDIVIIDESNSDDTLSN